MNRIILNFNTKFREYSPTGINMGRRPILNMSGGGTYTQIETEMEKKKFKLTDYLVLAMSYVILIILISLIVNMGISAAKYAVENTLTEQLISGTFDTRSEINNSASNFFTNMAGQIFAVALPFMSAFALTMITLSLVSSIIYLTKPDLFDEVHDLVNERKMSTKGSGVGGVKDFYRQRGIKDFVLSYCPDFKSWAFQDSVTAGVDGAPTFQDFLRNMPKYILMFTFCILITNRVLLDFLMVGATLTASLAEKVTYDHNYVELMENFLDQGKRYTPQQWTGKSRENTNLMTTYRAIYNTVIANLVPEQKDTETLQAIGMAVEAYMVEKVIPKEHWDRKVFSARAEYLPMRKTNVEAPGTYYIDGKSLMMIAESGTPGVIMLNIRSETDDKSYASTGVTRYPGAWDDGVGIPVTFNIQQIPGMPASGVIEGTNKSVSYVITGGTVLGVTIDGEAYNLNLSIPPTAATDGKITISYAGLPADKMADIKAKMKTVSISGLKIKIKTTMSDGTNRSENLTDFNTFDKPVWNNQKILITDTEQ